MRDRLNQILPYMETKYGKQCESGQITTIHQIVPRLLEGREDEERYICLDDNLELRLEMFAMSKNDAVYAISYAYEDAVMGSMVGLYLLRDLRSGKKLEQVTFSEDEEYTELAAAMESEYLNDSARNAVWGRMEEIRRGQIEELIHDSRSYEKTATYMDAAKLITLVQEAQQVDINNPQHGEAGQDW